VDPVFGFSKMSHVPSEFLSLDDNIFDEIRRRNTAGLSSEHAKMLREGKRMLALLDQRLGPQHVHMARKVPPALIQGASGSDINKVVCLSYHSGTWLVL
jgi:hypothetical protein